MVNISYNIHGFETNKIPDKLSHDDWTNIIVQSNTYSEFVSLKKRTERMNVIKKLI